MMGEVISAALKLKKAGSFQAAEQTLADGLLGIIPEQADLIEMVDERTVVTLLGDPRLIEAYCELLLERATINYVMQDEQSGENYQRRALLVFKHYYSRNGALTPNGHLLYGRMCGLELELLLGMQEALSFQEIGRLSN